MASVPSNCCANVDVGKSNMPELVKAYCMPGSAVAGKFQSPKPPQSMSGSSGGRSGWTGACGWVIPRPRDEVMGSQALANDVWLGSMSGCCWNDWAWFWDCEERVERRGNAWRLSRLSAEKLPCPLLFSLVLLFFSAFETFSGYSLQDAMVIPSLKWFAMWLSLLSHVSSLSPQNPHVQPSGTVSAAFFHLAWTMSKRLALWKFFTCCLR